MATEMATPTGTRRHKLIAHLDGDAPRIALGRAQLDREREWRHPSLTRLDRER